MRAGAWVRVLDYLIEACWLLALVAVPIFFDPLTPRIFEPDKIVLFRNIVLVMAVAAVLRLLVAAPGLMVAATERRDQEEGARRPWWRRGLARRPLLLPVGLFALVYSAATAHSVLPYISFWGSYDRLQGLYTWLSYMAFFVIVSSSIRSWAQVERAISAIVFTSIPVALYGIMQHLRWDPLVWGADTSLRVASTLGNSIFLGAYLLMCMPFTAYRLWRAYERWQARSAESRPGGKAVAPPRGRARQRSRDTIVITGVPAVVPVIGYTVALMLGFASIYFCGSRGAYYGFVAAVLIIGFPLTLKLGNPYPAITSIALTVALVVFPRLAEVPAPAIALAIVLVGYAVALTAARSRPAVALVALVLAILSFPQAINVLNAGPEGVYYYALIAVIFIASFPVILGLASPYPVPAAIALAVALLVVPPAIGALQPNTPIAVAAGAPATSSTGFDAHHLSDFSDTGSSQVRLYIWQGSLHLIAHNWLLGWGPEDMIYVYAPYYPSGLGHIERSNAAPDRNHDETLDFLVFSGVLGLLAWLATLLTFVVVAVRSQARARSRRAIMVVATVGAVVFGHLVEGAVGIGVVSTLMLLWTMFALATALYAQPDLLAGSAQVEPHAGGTRVSWDASAAPAVAAEDTGRTAGRGRVPRSGRDAVRQGAADGSRRQEADVSAGRTSLPGGGGTRVSAVATRGRTAGAWDASPAQHSSSGRRGRSNGAGAETRGRDSQAAGLRNRRPAAPPSRIALERLSLGQQGGLLGLVVVALATVVGAVLLFGNNVQVVRADAVYKHGQEYDGAAGQCLNWVRGNINNQSAPSDPLAAGCPIAMPQSNPVSAILTDVGVSIVPQAIAFYDQALSAQPHQDMYYLWLGKAYLDEATYFILLSTIQSTNHLPQAIDAFRQAESSLMHAHSLNPYNADHPMNLARMYTVWASIDRGQWANADKYYAIATSRQLAGHNGRWADEWGLADLQQATQHDATGKPYLTPAQQRVVYERALAAFQHACAVDDLLGDARYYRGNADVALGQYQQALASYAEALRVGGLENVGASEPSLRRAQIEYQVFHDARKAGQDYKAAVAANSFKQPGYSLAATVQEAVTNLYSSQDYADLVAPVSPGGQSLMTIAVSPTVAAGFTGTFPQQVQVIAATLRHKGFIK